MKKIQAKRQGSSTMSEKVDANFICTSIATETKRASPAKDHEAPRLHHP